SEEPVDRVADRGEAREVAGERFGVDAAVDGDLDLRPVDLRRRQRPERFGSRARRARDDRAALVEGSLALDAAVAEAAEARLPGRREVGDEARRVLGGAREVDRDRPTRPARVLDGQLERFARTRVAPALEAQRAARRLEGHSVALRQRRERRRAAVADPDPLRARVELAAALDLDLQAAAAFELAPERGDPRRVEPGGNDHLDP